MPVVTSVSDPVRRGGSRGWRKVGTVVVVNLVLGVPAVVPVWLAWFYLTVWPLAALGVTTGEPTENDGVLVASVVVLPIVALGVFAWFFMGLWLRRRVDAVKAHWFWPVSILAVLVPTAVLILVSLAS